MLTSVSLFSLSLPLGVRMNVNPSVFCTPSGTKIIASSRLITLLPFEWCFLCFRLIGLESDGGSGFLKSVESLWMAASVDAVSLVLSSVSSWPGWMLSMTSLVFSVVSLKFRSSSESNRTILFGCVCFLTFSIFWRPYYCKSELME